MMIVNSTRELKQGENDLSSEFCLDLSKKKNTARVKYQLVSVTKTLCLRLYFEIIYDINITLLYEIILQLDMYNFLNWCLLL